MISRAELKRNAKSQLKGNWVLAIIVCLVYSLIVQLTTVTTGSNVVGNNDGFMVTLNILGFILSGPIMVGFSRFTLNLAKGDSGTKFSNLFSGFNLFFKALIIMIVCNLAVIVGTMFFIIPGIIVALMFSQAYFILAENPELSSMECLSKSAAMMKGYKMNLFILDLSFIGWIIVCVFTFGIGYLWYMPYYEMTKTNFYLELKQQ